MKKSQPFILLSTQGIKLAPTGEQIEIIKRCNRIARLILEDCDKMGQNINPDTIKGQMITVSRFINQIIDETEKLAKQRCKELNVSQEQLTVAQNVAIQKEKIAYIQEAYDDYQDYLQTLQSVIDLDFVHLYSQLRPLTNRISSLTTQEKINVYFVIYGVLSKELCSKVSAENLREMGGYADDALTGLLAQAINEKYSTSQNKMKDFLKDFQSDPRLPKALKELLSADNPNTSHLKTKDILTLAGILCTPQSIANLDKRVKECKAAWEEAGNSNIKILPGEYGKINAKNNFLSMLPPDETVTIKGFLMTLKKPGIPCLPRNVVEKIIDNTLNSNTPSRPVSPQQRRPVQRASQTLSQSTEQQTKTNAGTRTP